LKLEAEKETEINLKNSTNLTSNNCEFQVNLDLDFICIFYILFQSNQTMQTEIPLYVGKYICILSAIIMI